MFKRFTIILVITICCAYQAYAQHNRESILLPVEQYLAKGDVYNLSQWFDEALEVTIFSKTNDSSINQARQILQTFFSFYTPRACKISHVVDRTNIEYAMGQLSAGGEVFTISLFISKKENGSYIQRLKIDRKNTRYRR